MLLALRSFAAALALSAGGPAATPAPSPDPELAALQVKEIAAEDRGDVHAALALAREIARRTPEDPGALTTVAGLHGLLGDFEAEVEWARKAIAAGPRYVNGWVNLGNGYAGLHRLDDARAAYHRAIEANPRSPLGEYSLGVLAEEARDVPGATAHYQRSVEIDPRFANGWFNLAAMLANAGRFDEALAALDRVLAITPGAKDALELQAQIRAEAARRGER